MNNDRPLCCELITALRHYYYNYYYFAWKEFASEKREKRSFPRDILRFFSHIIIKKNNGVKKKKEKRRRVFRVYHFSSIFLRAPSHSSDTGKHDYCIEILYTYQGILTYI